MMMMRLELPRRRYCAVLVFQFSMCRCLITLQMVVGINGNKHLHPLTTVHTHSNAKTLVMQSLVKTTIAYVMDLQSMYFRPILL